MYLQQLLCWLYLRFQDVQDFDDILNRLAPALWMRTMKHTSVFFALLASCNSLTLDVTPAASSILRA